MIGEVIQLLLDRGFSVNYRYGTEDSYRCHVFKIKKCYGGRIVQNSWAVSGDIMRSSKDCMIWEAEEKMNQVDEAITPYRLIEEALS